MWGNLTHKGIYFCTTSPPSLRFCFLHYKSIRLSKFFTFAYNSKFNFKIICFLFNFFKFYRIFDIFIFLWNIYIFVTNLNFCNNAIAFIFVGYLLSQSLYIYSHCRGICSFCQGCGSFSLSHSLFLCSHAQPHLIATTYNYKSWI